MPRGSRKFRLPLFFEAKLAVYPLWDAPSRTRPGLTWMLLGYTGLGTRAWRAGYAGHTGRTHGQDTPAGHAGQADCLNGLPERAARADYFLREPTLWTISTLQPSGSGSVPSSAEEFEACTKSPSPADAQNSPTF